MFLNTRVGNLIEPLSARHWDRAMISRRLRAGMTFLSRRGLEPGDRVFLHYGNTLEFFVDLLAIWNLGGCVIPIDHRLTQFEIDALAGAARPRFSLWTDAPRGDIAAALSAVGTQTLQMSEDRLDEDGTALSSPSPAARVSMDQAALILFTSGTTGHPKGVVHTHRSLRARWLALLQSVDVRHFRKTLCLLPTHSAHGLIGNALFPWLSGRDLHILPPFRPDLTHRLGAFLDEYGITFLSSVPAVWRLALDTAAPPTRGTLERVFCSSAPLSERLWKEIARWTKAGAVLNTYGMTETASWVAGTTLRSFEPEDGLIGVPWGAAVKVLRTSSTETPPAFAEECALGEEGYLWLNTAALMKGYLDRDDLTRQIVSQGWLVTGDIGVVRKGRLYLCSRGREEINKGGAKVHPGDIDVVVERYPATRDVCTFGVEDSLHGQNVAVAVVLDDSSEATLTSLHSWVEGHLAEHKVPVQWYLVETIPRTPGGKVNREEVARHCQTLEPVPLRAMLSGPVL